MNVLELLNEANKYGLIEEVLTSANQSLALGETSTIEQAIELGFAEWVK